MRARLRFPLPLTALLVLTGCDPAPSDAKAEEEPAGAQQKSGEEKKAGDEESKQDKAGDEKAGDEKAGDEKTEDEKTDEVGTTAAGQAAEAEGESDWPAPKELTASTLELGTAPTKTPAWTKGFEQAGKKLSFDPGPSGGLLLRIDGQPHRFTDEAEFTPVVEADAESPAALKNAPKIEGFWPKNAWRVSRRELDEKALDKEDLPSEWAEMGVPPVRFRFHTFRGNNRWVAQKTDGISGPDDFTVEEQGGVTVPEAQDQVVWSVSPRRGLIMGLADPASSDGDGDSIQQELLLERVGGGDDPDSIAYRDGVPVAVFETKGGRLIAFIGGFGSMVVQRSCAIEVDEAECAAKARFKLPGAEFGGFEEVTHSVHRKRHSASFGLLAKKGSTQRSFVLHYETGGYKLESLPEGKEIRQMLSAPGGGVWLVIGDELWHRGGGTWSKIAIPTELAGKGAIQVAKDRTDPQKIWISASNASAVFHTPADLLEPAPPPPG